ncbi:hypothetical protein MRB53_037408 [Persea americana]|nr:hypothetical protein MRB53_037408 [Persea americana]
MPFALRPATASHAHEIVSLIHAAYAPSPAFRAYYPLGMTPEARAFRVRKRIASMQSPEPGHYEIVVVDEATGEVAGYALWAVADKVPQAQSGMRGTGAGEASPEAEPIATCTTAARTTTAKDQTEDDVCPGYQIAASKARQQVEDAARKHIMGDARHLELLNLSVHPNYARKGAGTLALRWGLDKADAEGLDCYISASTEGRRLYAKHGFEVKRESLLDLLPFGVDEVNVAYGMVRRCRAT